MNIDLAHYYEKRAAEYEQIYEKPERRDDLNTLASLLQNEFNNKNIIEICCGTGYWTERIAQAAASIDASDSNEAVINIASQKNYGSTPVHFTVADFYRQSIEKKYEALFGGFIWSHIPIQHLEQFLKKANDFVKPGYPLVFIDNNYVEGSSLPITETDPEGNTFQTRVLSDGSAHLVCKNFPSRNFVMEQLKNIGMEMEWIELRYYWMVKYKPVFNY